MEKFKSKYTDKQITPAQFLAEKICERLARKDKIALSDQFWNQARWRRTFLYQVQIANGLLKIYSWQAVLRALNKNPGIYSLNAKFLDPLIKTEEESLQREERARQEHKQEEIKTADPTSKPRPSFTENTSIKAKLRDL